MTTEVLSFSMCDEAVSDVCAECSICSEVLPTSGKRGSVLVTSCVACHAHCCTRCLERTYLDDVSVMPRCPNRSCRIEVPRYVLCACFARSRLDGVVKRHAQDVLFDRERARFALSAPYAEKLRTIGELKWLRKRYVDEKSRASDRVNQLANSLRCHGEDTDVRRQMHDEDANKVRCRALISDVDAALFDLRRRCASSVRSPPTAFSLRALWTDRAVLGVDDSDHIRTLEAFVRGNPVTLKPSERLMPSEIVALRKQQGFFRILERTSVLESPNEFAGDVYGDDDDGTPEKPSDSYPQVYRCGVDDCGGYVSAHSWRCLKCNGRACPSCLCVSSDGHACDLDVLASVRLMRSETKPCPKCGVRIERTGGCDVMFCTACHAGFYWSNGAEVSAANMHNPHHHEWLAQINRVAGGQNPTPDPRSTASQVLQSIACDPNLSAAYSLFPTTCQLFTSAMRLRILKESGRIFDKPKRQLSKDVYALIDVVELARQNSRPLIWAYPFKCPVCNRQHDGDRFRNNDLRARFLADELTEAEFRSELYAREKAERAARDNAQVFETLAVHLAAACDAFAVTYASIESSSERERCDAFAKVTAEVNAIHLFGKLKFEEVGRAYGVKPAYLVSDDGVRARRH